MKETLAMIATLAMSAFIGVMLYVSWGAGV